MKLTAIRSNCEDIEDGTNISVSQNGRTVQVYGGDKLDLLVTLERVEVRFGMTDFVTEITITGFRCVNGNRGWWELVTIECS